MRQPSEIEVLYLDFDGFFASVEQQVDPRLRGYPVGIVPFSGTTRTCVIACSREAKAYGIKNVMNVLEAKSKCPDAAFALADKLGHGIVTCHQRDTDRYGRVVAVCTQNGVDLNRWMVRQGHAIAYRKYSTDYIADEGEARAAKLGIWAGEFTDPADFRHGKR